MSRDEPIGERMATAETQLVNHQNWISAIEKDCRARDEKLDGRLNVIEALLNKAKGGWFLLCLLCGGSAGVGALIVKLLKI